MDAVLPSMDSSAAAGTASGGGPSLGDNNVR